MGRNKNTLEWGWSTWWPNNDALWPRSLRWRSPFFVRGPLLWKKSGDVKLDRQVYQTKLSRFFKSRGPSPSSWIREIGSFAGGKFYWQFLQVTNSVTRACLFLDIRLNPNGVFSMLFGSKCDCLHYFPLSTRHCYWTSMFTTSNR